MRRVLALAAAAALLGAGCGGGGSSSDGSGGDTTTGGGGSSTTSNAYQAGFETCTGQTVAQVAELYGVAQKTPDAVAEVVAEQLAGGSGEHDDVKQGCKDAFAQAP